MLLGPVQDFVKFIVKGLEGNVLQPFAEGNFRKADLAAQNQVGTTFWGWWSVPKIA